MQYLVNAVVRMRGRGEKRSLLAKANKNVPKRLADRLVGI